LRIATAGATAAALLRPVTTKSVHFNAGPAASPGSLSASRRSSRRSSASSSACRGAGNLEEAAATVWWLDDLQLEEDTQEWVRLADRMRPSSAERKRVMGVLERERAKHMKRIVDYHRSGKEDVDEEGRSRLPPLTGRSSAYARHTEDVT
jgi:hypothetical protein